MPDVTQVPASTIEPKAPKLPRFTPADWARYTPTVERLIRESFVSTKRAAVDSTVLVNTVAMRQRVSEIIEVLGVRAGHKVGDFGCGYGLMALLLSAATGARVEAFDRTDTFLEVGRRFAEEHPEVSAGVRFEVLDHATQDPPAWASGYDAVIMHQTFHYIVGSANKQTALDRVVARLAPGGRVMVYVPNPWFPREPFTRLLGVQWLPRSAGSAIAVKRGRRDLSDIHHVSPMRLRGMFKRAGLRGLRYYPLGRADWRAASGRYRRHVAPVLCPIYCLIGTRPGGRA